MGKTAESQTVSSECFHKLLLLSSAVSVSFFIFICFLSFGFSSFLATICVLLLSTVFITRFSKKKVITVENPTQGEAPICRSNKIILEKEVDEQKPSPKLEAVTFHSAAEKSEGCDVHEYQVELTDFPSASESSDDLSASEDFELSWKPFNDLGKNVATSECSVSSSDEYEDDDNLIEIKFPDNSSSEMDEESEVKLEKDLPEYFPESIFRQEGLMELLAEINEVNEEENLIEIDLSMGSIKGSGLDI